MKTTETQTGTNTLIEDNPGIDLRAKWYPHSVSPELKDEVFARPGTEYRGAPFWSWNCKLDKDQLLRQIEQLKAMGMGGFHIHPRTGLTTEYLGDEFMECVRACVEKARHENMKAWLYDEDRWPSGFAGGQVTKEHRYRLRALRFTTRPYGENEPPPYQGSRARTGRGNGTILARFAVELKDGFLNRYEILPDDCQKPLMGRIWYAYRDIAGNSSWFNNQSYVDTMSAPALRKFIEITHERYSTRVGEYFGTVIPAIFTDEPQVVTFQGPSHPHDDNDFIIAYTDDFADTYRERWGEDFIEKLPELFWELPGDRRSPLRWRYRDHAAERFAAAFADVLGEWCGRNRLALTGHMVDEPTLASQTKSILEAMRHYRSFHLPGIDMLCDRMELTTAKQAASVAHQDGRPGVMSELYGVTNWDFTFAGHKRQGDWQAALGVTVRVHHLTWVTMKGNAKRDYPASIGYQSPWYLEYPLIEDHFARANYLLTRGKPRVRVGVIHPIESFWLTLGPASQTDALCSEQEERFSNITQMLLYGGIDFDFIAESLLPQQNKDQQARHFQVGQMAYEVIIVPSLITIRSSTLEKLRRFVEAGGQVIFAGHIPDHVDAQPSDGAHELAKISTRVPFHRTSILQALEPYRDVEIRACDGSMADDTLYQIREDGDRRHLFICSTRTANASRTNKTPDDLRYHIRIRGRWAVTLNDTLSGLREDQPVCFDGEDTVILWQATVAGSLLLTLQPAPEFATSTIPPLTRWKQLGELADPVSVTLHEPNVLVLDQAEFCLDDGPWQGREEIMRAENRMRAKLGWPEKTGVVAQPWCLPPDTERHLASFRFYIESKVAINGARLALEDSSEARILFNGKEIPAKSDGWWVDECLDTVPVPPISTGLHELIVEFPLTRRGSLEWMYLLGDFGVSLRGRHACLTEPVRDMAWGDWTLQGLPFYAGNITYHCSIEGSGQETALGIPHFKSPLITVNLDRKKMGSIAFDPYRLKLGKLPKGQHQLDITVYGNRVNAFGALHNCDPNWTWWGPNSWETKGDAWSYEYQLRPMGITVAPCLEG